MMKNFAVVFGVFVFIVIFVCSLDVKKGFAQSFHPKGEISLQIDVPTRNLSVFVNGTFYKKYPVALGKPSTPTPVGKWRIINKYNDWGGGFGTRWMGLNVPWGIYGIHGTTRPTSIGTYASNGCIRLHNRNVEELYDLVYIGVPVVIVGDPLEHFRRLMVGDIGADVQLIQQRLSKLGFYAGSCNGRFEESTREALETFEEARGLPIVGIVGMKEYEELGLTVK